MPLKRNSLQGKRVKEIGLFVNLKSVADIEKYNSSINLSKFIYCKKLNWFKQIKHVYKF